MAPATKHTRTERPPIIAVLGHVDHGKSTLLDYIRKSNTVEGEAGGITQHVAAYEAEHTKKDGVAKRITFIDTPGHAAFTAIRARGASIADIAILVVSAEDGVKEQTLEALASIKESAIPFVVAITKVDKPNANVDKVKTGLLEKGIYLEGLGGDVPWVAVSAKSGEGISDLLDMLLLVAELEELTGDMSAPAEGYVIEAHRDPKRGVAATVIITDGSLRAGMAVLARGAIAPLRIMEDSSGARMSEASFSQPVRIIGFDDLPPVGSRFTTHNNKRAAEKARDVQESEPSAVAQAVQVAGADTFTLPLIVKADASGSLEAIAGQVASVGDEHTRVRIIHSGIGSVSETDVKTAVASDTPAVIFGFSVNVDTAAEELARQNEVDVETFDIIYKLTERLAELLKERAPKRRVVEELGVAKVIKIFSRQRALQVLGGKVQSGHLARGGRVRITRRDTVIGVGRIKNMQTNRQDVDRVDAGSEFGSQIDSEFEIAPGDTLTLIVEREV